MTDQTSAAGLSAHGISISLCWQFFQISSALTIQNSLHGVAKRCWASRTLLELLRDSYLTFPNWSPQARIQLLQSTLTENGQQYPGTASTLLWAELQATRLTLCHVGDSRAWLIRDGEVKLLTEDQTVATDLQNAGYAADNHPLLASSYGALAEYFSVDAFVDAPQAVMQSMPFKEGDLLLLGTMALITWSCQNHDPGSRTDRA